MDTADQLIEILRAPSFDAEAFESFVLAHGGANGMINRMPILSYTAAHVSIEAVRHLIAIGADIPTLAGGPLELIDLIFHNDNLDMVQLLLDAGAPMSFVREGKLDRVVDSQTKADFLLKNDLITTEQHTRLTQRDATLFQDAAAFVGPLSKDFWTKHDTAISNYEKAVGDDELDVSPYAGEGLYQIADRFNK